MNSRLGNWLHQLTSDEQQLAADQLRDEARTSGTTQASDCCAGEKVEVFGRLRTVSLQPCDSLCALIAELYDGTDSVDLIWLGRRSIAGIEAGRAVRAQGRIAMRAGHKAIYNPAYQLMPVRA